MIINIGWDTRRSVIGAARERRDYGTIIDTDEAMRLADEQWRRWRDDDYIPTTRDLVSLCRDVKCGSGKWMIFPDTPEEADRLWREVMTALDDCLLGCSAKASRACICVYLDPFWDDLERNRVLRSLREYCGITRPLSFKADVVTHLGIYEGNELGIHPSFYHANENKTTSHILRDRRGPDRDRRGQPARIEQRNPNGSAAPPEEGLLKGR